MEQIKVKSVFPNIKTEGTLLATQMTALRYLRNIESNIGDKSKMQGCIFADDMGIGKTLPIAYLIYLNAVKKTLVITPLNTIYQIIKVFLTICLEFKVYIINSSNNLSEVSLDNKQKLVVRGLRSDEMMDKYSILVINREKLTSKKKFKIIKEYRYGRIVIDEGHVFRNNDITANEFLLKIPKVKGYSDSGKIINFCSTIIVTGTPIQNGISDLVNLFRIIDPNFLLDVKTEEAMLKELPYYIKRYLFRRTVSNFTDEMKNSMIYPLEDATIENVKIKLDNTKLSRELETKSWKGIIKMCKNDPTLKDKILKDEKAYIICATQKIREKSKQNGIIMNNLKIFLSNPFVGDIFEDEGDTTTFQGECQYRGKRSKENKIVEILTKNYNSFVLFHQYNPISERMQEVLRENFPNAEIRSICGKDKLEDRFNTLEECNDLISRDKIVFLFSSISATCEGMNYQSFSNGIFVDQNANPQQENQAMTRILRMLQDKHVTFWFILLSDFRTKDGYVNVDSRLRDIKDFKIDCIKIIDVKNAAWYFRRYTVLDSKGNRSSGVYFGEKWESKTKNGPDSIGPEDIK